MSAEMCVKEKNYICSSSNSQQVSFRSQATFKKAGVKLDSRDVMDYVDHKKALYMPGPKQNKKNSTLFKFNQTRGSQSDVD